MKRSTDIRREDLPAPADSAQRSPTRNKAGAQSCSLKPQFPGRHSIPEPFPASGFCRHKTAARMGGDSVRQSPSELGPIPSLSKACSFALLFPLRQRSSKLCPALGFSKRSEKLLPSLHVLHTAHGAGPRFGQFGRSIDSRRAVSQRITLLSCRRCAPAITRRARI